MCRLPVLLLLLLIAVIPMDALDFVTTSLPPGVAGVAYPQVQIQQDGQGLACCTWSVLSGLPPGMTVDCTWCESLVLMGTPAATGRYDIVIQLRDLRESVTRTLTLVVHPKMVVTYATSTSLPPAMVARAYSQPFFVVSGGAPPYRYSVAGTLPAGLLLDPLTGLISGTPVQAAASPPAAVWLSVEDSAGQGVAAAAGSCPSGVASCRFTLPVLEELRIDGPAVIPGALETAITAGQQISIAGGQWPMTSTLASGTLPSGVTVPGLLNGTSVPTQTGEFQVTLRITDSLGYQATKTLLLRISGAPLRITSGSAWEAMQNRPFLRAATAAGGTPPYRWSATGLPPPFTINPTTGAITGTPIDTCLHGCQPNPTLTITDAAGLTATQQVTISIFAELVITTQTLGTATINKPWSQRAAITGGAHYTQVIQYGVVSGVLPPGVTFNPANATFSGTPTQLGRWTVTLKAQDEGGFSAFRTLTLDVVPEAPAPAIVTQLVPPGQLGSPYTFQLLASGGTQPLTWVSGALPAGLSLNPQTGVLSGTPLQPTIVDITIQVLDAQQRQATRVFTLAILSANNDPRITTESLPPATPAFAYNILLGAAGGTPPYVWTLDSGMLPPGITLSTGGLLSGTPSQMSGTFSLGVRVTDAAARFAVRTYELLVGNSSEPCIFALTPSTFSAGPNGDILRVQVRTRSTCTWTVTNTQSWIAVLSATSATGPASVQLQVAANPTQMPRSAPITIAGQAFLIHQAAASCQPVPVDRQLTVAPEGGEQSLAISAPTGCYWTGAATVPWISLTSTATGSGTGTLRFQVAANTSRVPRMAAVSIGGHIVQVMQKAADPTVPFSDVPPIDPFFEAIAVLADQRIATTCRESTYCPSDPITREQMAIFVIRALMGGDVFSYPTTPYFTDVPATHAAFRHVQKMRELGITIGCTGTTYCPSDPVTRGQMAVFLVRARLGLSSTQLFPYSTAPYFTDVPPTHSQFPYIQKLRDLGITSGCTATTYCDGDPNLRGQMGVFVTRGLVAP